MAGIALVLAALTAGPRQGNLPAGSRGELTLTAVADAQVQAGSLAGRNFGRSEFIKVSGYLFDPSPPGFAIEPSPPRSGDRLTVRIQSPAVTRDGRPVAYRYLWHRYQDGRPVLIQEGPRPALERPVRAGERWRVVVAAISEQGRTAVSWAEAAVAEGKPAVGDGGSPSTRPSGDNPATPAAAIPPGRAPRLWKASPWGQFLHRRGYLAFDVTPLTAKLAAGGTIHSARLRLYVRPDASWFRSVVDTTLLVHEVPPERARFDETAITWRNQPTPEPVVPPLGRIGLTGRLVTENDSKWRAWSRLHDATWKDRARHATAFSNDPKFGLWGWREVDVTDCVRRQLASGAGRIAFCLTEPPRKSGKRSTCAVRTREYLQGRYAARLVVDCR